MKRFKAKGGPALSREILRPASSAPVSVAIAFRIARVGELAVLSTRSSSAGRFPGSHVALSQFWSQLHDANGRTIAKRAAC